MEQSDLIKAHAFCRNNRNDLLLGKKCGCFYCLKVFHSWEISEWIEDGDGTAVCPYCGIDSVIGENDNYFITEDFLKEMNKYWF